MDANLINGGYFGQQCTSFYFYYTLSCKFYFNLWVQIKVVSSCLG